MRTRSSASKSDSAVKVEEAGSISPSARQKRRGPECPAKPGEATQPAVGSRRLSKLARTTELTEVDAKAGVPDSEEGIDVNDFEMQRMRLIQQNRERMMQLKLPDIAAPAAGSEKPAKPTNRGIASRRSKKAPEDPAPLRRSSRQRGQQADAILSQGVDYETRGGQVVLHAAVANISGTSSEVTATPKTPVYEIEEIPFSSEYGEEHSDAAFLAQLRSWCAPSAKPSSETKPKPSLRHSYSLQEKHARKVTQRSVTHVDFAPLPGGQLLLAAADKEGNVGLWDIDKSADAEEEDNASVLFKAHHQYVSGMAWKPDGIGLYTLAYDGCLRFLDVERGVFQRVHYSTEEEYSALECSSGQGSEVAYMADNTGSVRAVDVNTGSTCQELKLHDRKINSLSLDPSGRPLLVTASTDTTVAVWDLRKAGKKAKPLASLPHNRSSHGAFWDPSGQRRLATIALDDSVRVYDETLSGDFSLAQKIRHNNNTGRWILTFKPRWSPSGDTIAVGSMGRGIDFIDPETGSVAQVVQADCLTAIPSRNAFHPWRSVLAATTASGRVHIFQ